MKVVLVNHSDSLGGASVVTYRLMEALIAQGVDARMLVVKKSTGSPYVAEAAGRFAGRMAFLAEHMRIFMRNGFDRSTLFKISTATDGLPLHRHPWVREADVVALNWVNQGMLSLKEIGRLARIRPVVWTMHDMWCATGVCHHAGTCDGYLDRCGHCPLIKGGRVKRDLSRVTWMRKSGLYSSSEIRFVAVSNWLAERCRHSSLLSHMPVSVIPNAFPVEDFPPSARTAEGGRRRIIMGAARLDDPIKGLPFAVEALNILADSCPGLAERAEAVFFGAVRDPEAFSELRFPHRLLGGLSGRDELARAYAGADVVLSTSLYETLPGTVIEGMAAGCVPVATNRGGQGDIIDHLSTGYLAQAGSARDIAEGLRWALCSATVTPEELHGHVSARFSAESVAGRYIGLFNEMLKIR